MSIENQRFLAGFERLAAVCTFTARRFFLLLNVQSCTQMLAALVPFVGSGGIPRGFGRNSGYQWIFLLTVAKQSQHAGRDVRRQNDGILDSHLARASLYRSLPVFMRYKTSCFESYATQVCSVRTNPSEAAMGWDHVVPPSRLSLIPLLVRTNLCSESAVRSLQTCSQVLS